MIEMGTGQALGNGIRESWAESGDGVETPDPPVVVSSLREASEGNAGFVDAVTKAYESGVGVAFTGLFSGEERRRVPLPGYPFQRRRHWVDAPK